MMEKADYINQLRLLADSVPNQISAGLSPDKNGKYIVCAGVEEL